MCACGSADLVDDFEHPQQLLLAVLRQASLRILHVRKDTSFGVRLVMACWEEAAVLACVAWSWPSDSESMMYCSGSGGLSLSTLISSPSNSLSRECFSCVHRPVPATQFGGNCNCCSCAAPRAVETHQVLLVLTHDKAVRHGVQLVHIPPCWHVGASSSSGHVSSGLDLCAWQGAGDRVEDFLYVDEHRSTASIRRQSCLESQLSQLESCQGVRGSGAGPGELAQGPSTTHMHQFIPPQYHPATNQHGKHQEPVRSQR